jgi:hypothetical protein
VGLQRLFYGSTFLSREDQALGELVEGATVLPILLDMVPPLQ